MTEKIDLSTLDLPFPTNSETFLKLKEECFELNSKLQASKGSRKAWLKTDEGRRFIQVGTVLIKNKVLLKKEEVKAKLLDKKGSPKTKRVSKYSYMLEEDTF